MIRTGATCHVGIIPIILILQHTRVHFNNTAELLDARSDGGLLLLYALRVQVEGHTTLSGANLGVFKLKLSRRLIYGTNVGVIQYI